MRLLQLTVQTKRDDGVAHFRLTDEHGQHVGGSDIRLADHSPAMWQGLFDTRAYVGRYAGATKLEDGRTATPDDILETLGVFLGQKVLGPKVLPRLWDGTDHRTLIVRFPDTSSDDLAAAFARVPWELARPKVGAEPLVARNVVVRVITADCPDPSAAPAAVELREDEAVRVLLVFAEAPGSRPLAMRRERERLLELFYDDILPHRRVAVDVLCHGVTRELLTEKVTDAGGYHIVHWSGHGHRNLLELRGKDGEPERITGEELVKLFQEAGGFIPQLVFLSACLSGALTKVHDWQALRAYAAGARPDAKEAEAPELGRLLAQERGYTSTALELLRAKVPQVVAMRYEVGDAYARRLARRFYRHLLADQAHHPADSALALARAELLRDEQRAAEHEPVDHFNPLILGRQPLRITPAAKRSAQLAHRWPRPQPLLGGSRELDAARNFVGRGRELTRLATEWLPRDMPGIALVQGLAGLGKTALAAEGIHLWHQHFDWVFAFQAKPSPLQLDEFYRQLDSKLALESKPYRDKCEERPNSRVYLLPRQELTGEARYERLRDNLLEALRDERILLVLDNFDTQVRDIPTDGLYACADPQWDRLLEHLAERLSETGSRVLITSRHRLGALAPQDKSLWIPLGPLPIGEAVLFIQEHDELRKLWYSANEGDRELVLRLLNVSRGHPLILTRLAGLADDAQALSAALDRLQQRGLRALPDLFDEAPSDAQADRVRDYLEDVAFRAVDLLIERLSADARRLLWIVTLASEPPTQAYIEGVWSGQTLEDEQLRELRAMLAMGDQLPAELREKLKPMPDELREQLEQLKDDAPAAPPVGPLLTELVGVGLLTVEDPEELATYSFHELVRERISAWMAAHPGEKVGRAEAQVWEAYGERYAAAFQHHRTSGEPGARDVAAEAGRRALSYFIRAGAFQRLGFFASALVTGTRDPTLLRGVIAELATVAEQVPPGKERWSVRTYLADALSRAGRPDEALALYEQAVAEAEEAGDWSDVAWICQNWANALRDVGRLDKAKPTFLRSAEAERKRGAAEVYVVASELEALRIDVIQGQAKQVLPEIEKRLKKVRRWWRAHRAGKSVPEAPDPIMLPRALVSALDIARTANLALERCQPCLDLIDEIDQTQGELGEGEYERACVRFNKYAPLLRLRRLDEAQHVLEGCLAVFRGVDDLANQARALTALGDVWDERRDVEQAVGLQRQALSVLNRLPDPSSRAISHANLSTYLERSGRKEESMRHQLAAIVYRIVAELRQDLSTDLRNLAIDVRRAAEAGGRYELPRLADLLARPEFEPLKQFLAEREVSLDRLQQQIDALVEEVRKQAK